MTNHGKKNMYLIKYLEKFLIKLSILLLFWLILFPIKIFISPILIINKLIPKNTATYRIKSKKRTSESLKKIY